VTQTAIPPHPAVPASYAESYRRKGEPGADGVGELAMRGPELFVDYLGQEQLYGDLLTEDGFFRTGDLATICDDGYLRLAGRLNDLKAAAAGPAPPPS
jgi:long-subunit acyl-CoA synthetase (AMP-forming)